MKFMHFKQLYKYLRSIPKGLQTLKRNAQPVLDQLKKRAVLGRYYYLNKNGFIYVKQAQFLTSFMKK